MWIADHTVNQCSCGKVFSLLTRRHHCRKCGHIFCDQCTSGKATIPSFARDRWEGQQRVCAPCHDSIRTMKSVEYLVRVFALLPFDMPPVCKKWRLATATLSSVVQQIPQKMLHVQYSRLERTLLRTRSGTPWATRLGTPWAIRRLCIVGLHEDVDVSCSDMVQILNSHYGVHVLQMHKAWVLRQFDRFETSDIVRFMPWWLQTNVVLDLLDLHVRIDFAYALYFECAADATNDRNQRVLRALLKRMSPETKNEIKATDNLIRAVERSIVRPTTIVPAKLPYDPSVTVYRVLGVVQLGSASKPHAVTLDTSVGEIQVLIKTADLRKDKCTMVLCRMLRGMGIRCLVYPVFVTPRGGWVQMLASKTLYELGNSLSTYVYNQFPDTAPKITKAKFRRSVVGSCILSYIVGLGDRHLQNIVVCNGELTHIDFSYMFGHDPKITQPLRVTAPTIQMMGGKDSPEYALFLREVQEAFEIVRARRSLWCTLLENIAHADLYTLSEIRRHAKLIGSPGVEVVDIVKNHSDTWVHALGDVVHGMFQFKF